jgi:predicted amidohydrolase
VRDLNVALVQRALVWEDPVTNREQIAADLEALPADTDLVVLPEMFTTGFSMNSDSIAEDDAAASLPWMQELAARHDIAVTGSLAVRSGGAKLNRLLLVKPDGSFSHYDKRHLFRMSGEHEHYAPGDVRVVVEWRGWRLCPMICYDLRFPVWTRNRGDYDLLLFVANWPSKRSRHWRQLLIARAIENQACCIGVNRIGTDGNGLDYSGDSLAVAADGEILLDCESAPGLFCTTFDYAAMQTYREKFPFQRDADGFHLET